MRVVKEWKQEENWLNKKSKGWKNLYRKIWKVLIAFFAFNFSHFHFWHNPFSRNWLILNIQLSCQKLRVAGGGGKGQGKLPSNSHSPFPLIYNWRSTFAWPESCLYRRYGCFKDISCVKSLEQVKINASYAHSNSRRPITSGKKLNL